MRAVHGRRQTDTSDEISLGTVARAVWRNKRAIIGPTLLIAAAAFVAVNLITPRYKSEARVLFDGRENIFLRPEAEKTLMDRGIETSVHHVRNDRYSVCAPFKTHLPNMDWVESRYVCLPLHNCMTVDQAYYIAEVAAEALKVGVAA